MAEPGRSETWQDLRRPVIPGELEAKLADPSLYLGSTEKVTELHRNLRAIERKIAEAEHDWLEALEAG